MSDKVASLFNLLPLVHSSLPGARCGARYYNNSHCSVNSSKLMTKVCKGTSIDCKYISNSRPALESGQLLAAPNSAGVLALHFYLILGEEEQSIRNSVSNFPICCCRVDHVVTVIVVMVITVLETRTFSMIFCGGDGGQTRGI